MRNTLTVQVMYTSQDLLEAALDFGWRHASPLDCGVQVSTWAELHDFTPVHVFILDEVNGFHDIRVV